MPDPPWKVILKQHPEYHPPILDILRDIVDVFSVQNIPFDLTSEDAKRIGTVCLIGSDILDQIFQIGYDYGSLNEQSFKQIAHDIVSFYYKQYSRQLRGY